MSYKKRLAALQKKMARQKLGALLVTNLYNLRYLTGFVGTNGRLLVTPKKVTLITDFRYLRMARKMIPDFVDIYDQKSGLKALMGTFKKIGYEEQTVTVYELNHYQKAFSSAVWVPVSGWVEEGRLIKDADEIATLKKACRITDQLFKEFKKTVRVGQSEDQMEQTLYTLARQLGADGFSFPPIICFGKNTADVHHIKESNRLKKGEPVLLDMGITYKGYATDMTRMIYLNKAKPIEQKIYSIVKQANMAAIKAVTVGKTCGAIDRVARQIIEKAGYGDRFGHSTGHGVGLEVHEAPTVSAQSAAKIKPGMVFTIEPGIYLDDLGGVRIEDMVYITPKGKVEVLTKSPK